MILVEELLLPKLFFAIHIGLKNEQNYSLQLRAFIQDSLFIVARKVSKDNWWPFMISCNIRIL